MERRKQFGKTLESIILIWSVFNGVSCSRPYSMKLSEALHSRVTTPDFDWMPTNFLLVAKWMPT